MTTQMTDHPSQNGGGAHDETDNLSSFQIIEGGLEPGDYSEYVGLIDRATLQRLNSPDDFFAEANFPSEEYGDVVLGYYELGMEQMYARCNNREAELAYLRKALAYIDGCKEKGGPYESAEVSMLMIAQLELLQRRGKWDDEEEGINAVAEQYNNRLDTLVTGIEYDQKLGVYRDYTKVRRKWQEAMGKKESVMGAAVGDIVQDMPEFFKIAISMARRTESGTRRIHIQSLLARVTEKVSDLMGFRSAQGSMGANTSRGRRRFLGGGRDNEMAA